MGARRKARELALQMLYQHDVSGNPPDTIITTFDNLQKIDAMIVQQADNWRIERMAVVDRNIIRMSIYEFLHENDTPKLVVIDEAIEIAKKFGTQKSSQFINGILDGILKRYNLA